MIGIMGWIRQSFVTERAMTKDSLGTQSCSTPEMVKYSLGACTESLILNSFFGFAMLYYTKALGLSPKYAGVAAFMATIWDAVSDPIMGHISDNTRSRFGKRHPYMLFGGAAMILSFFFIWYIPEFFKSDMTVLFWYLVVMNLLLRSAYTVFIVPYTALSFEICQDNTGRSKIQGIRTALNMAANIFGCALAWTLFFGHNTETIRATNVSQNYVRMGTTFTIASCLFLFLMLAFTRKHIKDSSRDETCSRDVLDFFRDVAEIILDKYSRWVFIFVFFVLLGIVLVSSLQMYVFEDFMYLGGWQKTITHGGTMVGMGLGSLFGAALVRRFDKKGAICVGVCWGVLCELVLALLFLTGLLKPGQTIDGFPISFVLFSFFHGAYWFGNGVLVPISVSMMADISEIHQIKTGVNKDGSYAAMYSLTMKTSMSMGMLIAGYCLSWVGYVSGSDVSQPAEVVWRICALTFVVGPVASLMALALILKYPVSKAFIENIRGESKP